MDRNAGPDRAGELVEQAQDHREGEEGQQRDHVAVGGGEECAIVDDDGAQRFRLRHHAVDGDERGSKRDGSTSARPGH